MPPPAPPADAPAFALLTRLTELLLRWSYEGTAGAEAIVARVGARYGTPARASFLADQATLTVGERVVAFGATPVVPPLHQVSALKGLLAEIDAGRLPVAEARRRLAELTARPPRFGPAWRVVGMVAFSAGFGASIQATWQEVAASAALGVLVGLLFVAAEGRERLTLVAPFAGSVLVSTLVLIAFEHDWIDGGPIQLMIPALFIFIPGDALSAAMLELADGRMTAGASRLVASFAVLLMLGFGALVATVLVDLPQGALFESDVPGNLGPLAVWGAWVVFAVGVMLVFSMAPRDVPWALALVLGTAGVATLGTAAAGEAVGTFLGAVAMTVVALLLGRRPALPPPYVLYLGAFYALTPGSHGLRGIESWIGGDRIQGATSVAEMLGLLTAIALGMLLGAAAVRRPRAAGRCAMAARAAGADDGAHAGDRDPSDARAARDLHAFVLELGRALSLAGAAVSETQERLTTIAAANGARDARIVVLPTALMIAFGRARWATIEAIPQLTGALRLDQISALYELVKQAEHGEVEPDEGLRRIAAIRAMRPRHGRVVTVLGYVVMTVGLCLVLQPSWSDVGISAAFGALVGCFVLLARGRQTLVVLVPVISAIVVSALTFELVKHGIADPGLRTLIAPLVTFLPGGVLTTATVELASGEMVAGASRLVFGTLQLLLLAFGIVAGAELAGLPSESVLQDEQVDLLGWWAPWLGVVVFGLAAALYFSAPSGSVRWLLVVLLAAWLGQVIGDRLVSADVSGFFGALAMTPIALAVARLPSGPPSQVTFLPAFWLLVPGAIGLIGVTEVVGNPAAASLEDLIEPLGSIVAIALGVLCGASIWRGAVSAPSRLLRRAAP